MADDEILVDGSATNFSEAYGALIAIRHIGNEQLWILYNRAESENGVGNGSAKRIDRLECFAGNFVIEVNLTPVDLDGLAVFGQPNKCALSLVESIGVE